MKNTILKNFQIRMSCIWMSCAFQVRRSEHRNPFHLALHAFHLLLWRLGSGRLAIQQYNSFHSATVSFYILYHTQPVVHMRLYNVIDFCSQKEHQGTNTSDSSYVYQILQNTFGIRLIGSFLLWIYIPKTSFIPKFGHKQSKRELGWLMTKLFLSYCFENSSNTLKIMPSSGNLNMLVIVRIDEKSKNTTNYSAPISLNTS